MRKTVRKALTVESVTDLDDEGRFSALVSVFGVLDSYREVVQPGAFKDSLARLGDDPLPILWNHRWDDLAAHLGGATGRETDEGLVIDAQLDREDPLAMKVYRLLKQKRIKEFSIGGFEWPEDVEQFLWEDGEPAWKVHRFELVEVSVVLRGANAETRLLGVKSLEAALEAVEAADPHAEDPAPPEAAEIRADDPPVPPATQDSPPALEPDEDAPQGADEAGTPPAESSPTRQLAAALLALTRPGPRKQDLMNPRALLKAAREKWAAFAAKAAELSEDEAAEVLALRSEISDLEAQVAKLDEAEAALKSFSDNAPVVTRDRDEAPVTGSLGERFVKSAEYRAMRSAHPSGIGRETPIDVKARHIGDKRSALKADPAPLNTAANGDITSPPASPVSRTPPTASRTICST
ncbi:HK97 family phage prohead protease [Rathayibacter sp. VKM Ac-2630]|uniref:HK97 family phage prohead protease n=1 Tax=Rathayibacter sp. VKM Ac-2630 TaxID=1938617 RepID=UPI000980C0AB|nr:HK97 family phage prohead protease [Rathayibacter sp. VKM Ac-2630]OOB90740.1 hypothetical protein B0T42_10050 [Rathayibacter sp. VKM Ac-2630]